MSKQQDNTQELTEERIREIVTEEIETWWLAGLEKQDAAALSRLVEMKSSTSDGN